MGARADPRPGRPPVPRTVTVSPLTAPLAVALALAAWTATGCGPGDPSGEPGSAPDGDGRDAPPDAPLSADPPPRRGRPSRPPSAPTDQIRPRTLTGAVIDVAGRTVLDVDGVRWALRGSIAGLAPGDTVTLTGRPTGEVDAVCGHPVLRVTSVDTR